MILSFYLSGIGTAAFALSGLFFFKFWRVSQDRFFAYLCAACVVLAFERVVGLITYLSLPTDELTLNHVRGWIYFIRMVVFFLIAGALVSKNRSRLL